ncbi:MAG: SulP family inorganic anion transporter, partial [Acidimicrobiales bacterium]
TGHFLLGGAVISIVVGLKSQFRGVVALPQDTPTAVLAVVVVSLVSAPDETATSEELFATILAMIVISTLSIGLIFWLVGRYRLAVLGQYVPYPVVAGFLAATGWLLFKSSFAVMAGVAFDFGDLESWWSVRELWLPGVVMAVVLFILTQTFASGFIVPVVVACSTIGYHIVRIAGGTSRDEAIADGWLLEPLPNEPLVEAVDPADVQWSAITDEAFGLATVAIVALIGVLLNLTALGSTLDQETDVDREMRIAGLSNVGAAAFGSIVGFHYVSLSTLGRSMRGNGRLVGVVVGLCCLTAALVGAGALAFVPQFVLGGMILFIGLQFLYDWLFLSARSLTLIDTSIIVGIIAVVELVGFLEGIVVGLLATIIHFVVTYSKAGAIRNTFTGQEMHSPVERSTAQRVALSRDESGIVLMKLQGHVFFASTVGLVDAVKDRLAGPDDPVTHLVLDFEHVTGVDSSGFQGFSKLDRLTERSSVQLSYAAVSDQIAAEFERRATPTNGLLIRRYHSAEDALEAAEDDLLERAGLDPDDEEFSLDYTLREMFPDQAHLNIFTSLLTSVQVSAGEILDTSVHGANLDFVESGRLTIWSSSEPRTRIRRAGPGSVLGIASFFKHGGPSSLVQIRADTDCTVRRLTTDQYFRLAAGYPEVAASLQRHALVTISDRFADLITSFEVVMRGKA